MEKQNNFDEQPKSYDELLENGDSHALIEAARDLLDLYVGGDDDLDLSPLTTAQYLLRKVSSLVPEKRQEDEEVEKLNKGFEIASVSREDLITHGLPKVLALSLTDDDMEEIASAMSDTYNNVGYWEDLDEALRRIFREKADESAISQVPLSEFVEEDGKFIAFDSDGNPCYYVDSDFSIYCASCVNAPDGLPASYMLYDEKKGTTTKVQPTIMAGFVHYGEESLTCASCERELLPANTDPTVPYETGEDLNKEGDYGETDIFYPLDGE